MKVMAYNDEVIRTIRTFKKYNQRCSEIISEDYQEVKDRRLEKPLFCGVFTAKIYVGNQIIGKYRFDCRHYRNWESLDVLTPRLTKIG